MEDRLKNYLIKLVLKDNGDFEYEDEYAIRHNDNYTIYQQQINDNSYNTQLLRRYIEELSHCNYDFQSGIENSNNDFLRIRNRKDDEDCMARIYISPRMDLTPTFAAFFIKHNLAINPNEPFYFKIRVNPNEYRESVDQFVSYISNPQQLKQQCDAIRRIYDERPDLFSGMKRAEIWGLNLAERRNESDTQNAFNNVFLVPEPFKRFVVGMQGECRIVSQSYGQCVGRFVDQARIILSYLDSSETLSYKDKEKIVSQLYDGLFHNRFLLGEPIVLHNGEGYDLFNYIKVEDTEIGRCLIETCHTYDKTIMYMFTPEMKNDYRKFLFGCRCDKLPSEEYGIRLEIPNKEYAAGEYKNRRKWAQLIGKDGTRPKRPEFNESEER